MKKFMNRFFVIIFLACSTTSSRADDALVADLSSASISVTTSFIGTSLMVFGALDKPAGPLDDLIVSVEGPSLELIVHRKQRQYGLWVDGPSARFDHVQGFYSIASTRQLGKILNNQELEKNELNFRASTEDTALDTQDFHEALIRLQEARGLYNLSGGSMHLISGRLFRADFSLPANVPIGSYTVHIAAVHDRHVVATRELALTIDESGLAAFLRHAAYDGPFSYAICSLAVVLACGAGGAMALRKG